MDQRDAFWKSLPDIDRRLVVQQHAGGKDDVTEGRRAQGPRGLGRGLGGGNIGGLRGIGCFWLCSRLRRSGGFGGILRRYGGLSGKDTGRNLGRQRIDIGRGRGGGTASAGGDHRDETDQYNKALLHG